MTTDELQRGLFKVRPEAQWVLHHVPVDGVEYVAGIPGLVWLDEEQPAPTPQEVEAAVAIVWRDPVIAEFKAEREKLLNRMMSIAGRVARNGEPEFAAALDWMAEQIIPLDTHPQVTAATDAESMREAFKQAYRAVAVQALAQAPDQPTALAWKTEIDKVFK